MANVIVYREGFLKVFGISSLKIQKIITNCTQENIHLSFSTLETPQRAKKRKKEKSIIVRTHSIQRIQKSLCVVLSSKNLVTYIRKPLSFQRKISNISPSQKQSICVFELLKYLLYSSFLWNVKVFLELKTSLILKFS